MDAREGLFKKKVNANRAYNVITVILYLLGSILLIWADWRIFIGVFFVLWAHSVEKHRKFDMVYDVLVEIAHEARGGEELADVFAEVKENGDSE